MNDPLSRDDLEAIRDNEVEPCWGCGCVPRLEFDGFTHRYHRLGCPVTAAARAARRLDDEA
jgi:hypothetical protein